MLVHEQKHIDDLNKMNSSICRVATPGQPIRPPKSMADQMEVRAYDAEINCLNKKLSGAECPCKGPLQDRINEVTNYRNEAAAGSRR
jgi:hypothetical protein